MWYKASEPSVLSRAFLYTQYVHTITTAILPLSLVPRHPFPDSRLVWHRSACYRKGESGVSELIILARCDNRRFQQKGRKGAIETVPLSHSATMYAITSNRSRTSGSRDIYVLTFSYSLPFCLSLLLSFLFSFNKTEQTNDNFL